MSTITELPIESIRDVATRHGVRCLWLFGSAVAGDFTKDSDLDFIVTFRDDDLGPWMCKITLLTADLEKITGRRVDLVPMDSLKWQLKDDILRQAVVIHEV